jgi:acetylornithine deacetylase/succinyl-diaminopimelate desuccinylase-like protein
MSGGYHPTQTHADSRVIKAVLATYRKLGLAPQVLARNPGSWPGYRFTNPPLSLAATEFGLGHGTGAHAPDEYYLIDSTNPKVQGLDGAIASFVECRYALA